MRVLLGKLQSDQPDLLNGELEEAEDCIPFVQSYGPFPRSVNYSNVAPAPVIGAVSTKDISGNVYTFMGTASQLYKESATALDNVSRTASYAASVDARWQFEVFGNTVLAVNGSDAMQVYTMGTSTRFLDQSASASAPVAACIATVRDFVMVGNIAGAGNRVQWSRVNNPLRWDISQRYQSDLQDLPGLGQRVQAITGGDFAAILTESSVWRASYVGAPIIFRFDQVNPGIGCLAPGSAARFQNMTYFLSSSGFYAFDGSNCIPIGYEQIDEKVLGEIDLTALEMVSAAIDPVNKLYVVAYPNKDATGSANRIAMYNWAVQKWAFASEDVRVIFNHLSPGYTLDQLNAFGSMESLQYSLDSRVWQEGTPTFAAVSSRDRIIRFEGEAKTANFITGEAQIVQGNRAFVRGVRPLVEGNSDTEVSVRIGTRDRLIDDVAWTGPSDQNYIGLCPVRANARFHRVRMTVAGGFTRAMGFDIDFVKEGHR